MSDNNKAVLVEVLNGTNSGGGGCSCCSSAGHCGTTPEQEMQEITDRLSNDLSLSFGDRVQVKLVNIDETGLSQYPMVTRVLEMGYPYPITLIDGEPKFAGGIMTPDIINTIEELMLNQ